MDRGCASIPAVERSMLELESTPPISSVSLQNLRAALAGDGLVLDFGAFSVRLRSRLPDVGPMLRAVYANHPFEPGSRFADTTISLLPAPGIRRWIRPLARLEVDGIDPFGLFGQDQLLPHFEWGVNWAFATMCNAHLLLHSGVVEIGDMGVMLVAKPGSGKSTLTAGLVGRGARLLSDEFGVIRVADLSLIPMAKPIALKNQSIQAMRRWSPEARIGPTYLNTRKGNLAHQAVPEASVTRINRAARPRLILFPQWVAGHAPSLQPVAHARAFMELAANSFNYEILGQVGFQSVAELVEQCQRFRLEYGELDDAVEAIFRLCKDLTVSRRTSEC